MANNPYDEFVQNFTRIMEELIEQLPAERTPNFVGCTIITGSGDPASSPHDDGCTESDEDYEVIETSDRVFISAEIPPDISDIPRVLFRERGVTLVLEGDEEEIDLECSIDTDSSFYTVQNSVLDIICYKR